MNRRERNAVADEAEKVEKGQVVEDLAGHWIFI